MGWEGQVVVIRRRPPFETPPAAAPQGKLEGPSRRTRDAGPTQRLARGDARWSGKVLKAAGSHPWPPCHATTTPPSISSTATSTRGAARRSPVASTPPPPAPPLPPRRSTASPDPPPSP